MNNKRFRNHIYHFIDVFFLSFPFLFILYYTISPLFILNLEFDTSNFSSYTRDLMFFISANFSDAIDLFSSWITDGENFSNLGFFALVDNFVSSIINFIGITYESDAWFWIFLQYYLDFIICYEFISLIINVALWIPRYFRDWSQRHSSEGV